ncbi:hypothetical protein PoB_003558900 [Plakobranchus ocellatus]|uniref:Uncharacterized protein n=1 Tax=Plakobranchus ocellatus TaxID=259542 RepID=A0AAV4ARY8_9GAST|nr:hypothetical protein PoB_003558900 [Plakobranchus ocellatus]
MEVAREFCVNGASTSGNENNPPSPRTVILRQRAKVRSHTVAGIIQPLKQTSSNTTPARESDTKSSTDYKSNDALDDDANEKWAANVSLPKDIERKTPNKFNVSPAADIFSVTRNTKNPNLTPDNEERNFAGPANGEETKSFVDTDHNLLCTEKQKAEGDMTASPKNPNVTVADTTTKRNPRNRIRPGQSTFPPQHFAESENKDQEGNATEQSDVFNTDIGKLEPEKSPETAPSEIEKVEMLAPVRPRNPRNRIRPGHSTFTADTKSIPPVVPATVPDAVVSEPLSGNQHTIESKHQVSFMQTCLSTNEQEKKLPITKDQNQLGLSGDNLGEFSKELKSKPSSRQIQRMRSRPLKLQASGPGSLFTEHKRPDFCRIRLTAMKNLNYDTRVRAFCEKVEELGESAAHCDYYAAKMQKMAAAQKKFVISDLANVSGPSEEDYRRHSGNTAIPCITLKPVRRGEQTTADTAYYSFLSSDLDFHSSKSAPVSLDEVQQEV